jgi:hypothetical protein
MDIKDKVLERTGWIYLAEGRGQWRTYVNSPVKLWVPHFFIVWAPQEGLHYISLAGKLLKFTHRAKNFNIAYKITCWFYICYLKRCSVLSRFKGIQGKLITCPYTMLPIQLIGPVIGLAKDVPCFTKRTITVLTEACQFILSWGRSVQLHCISPWSILTVSSCLHLGSKLSVLFRFSNQHFLCTSPHISSLVNLIFTDLICNSCNLLITNKFGDSSQINVRL